MIGYNRMTGYNKARYNGDGVEIAFAESVSLSDSTVAKESKKIYSELVVLGETVAKQQNKSVTETIRLDAWLREKKEQSTPWSD